VVNGSVSARVSDVTIEGGNGMEEVGIGFWVAIKIFYMGKDVA